MEINRIWIGLDWNKKLLTESPQGRADIDDSIMNADVTTIQKRREDSQTRFKDRYARETRWAKILIPELMKTNNSICIAVGAAHLVGVTSLTYRFKQAGLKVELIDPNNPNNRVEFAASSVLARTYCSSPAWLSVLMEQASYASEIAEDYYDLDLLSGITFHSGSK